MKPNKNLHHCLEKNYVKDIVEKNFSLVSPYFYKFVNEWMIDAYKTFNDLDKYLILIFILDDDLKFFKNRNIQLNFDEFYSDTNRENTSISIKKISLNLNIPKESARRKVEELSKIGLIKRDGKNIILQKNGYKTTQAHNTIKNISSLIYHFNTLLNSDRKIEKFISQDKITKLIKEKFTSYWHELYIFLFSFCKRWRTYFGELELFLVGHTIVLNSIYKTSKQLKGMKSYTEKCMKDIQNQKSNGINVMSVSEITGIPRATVIRKVNYLLKNNYIGKDKSNLLIFKSSDDNFRSLRKLQDDTLDDLSNLMTNTINEVLIR